MKVIIIGNGILGLTTAYRLLKKDSTVMVDIIGPETQDGCASLAAAAMFNSFCEIDQSTLSNKVEKEKFLFNKEATPLWKSFLKEIEEDSKVLQDYGFGTYLINNPSTDSLEDKNFDAILEALVHFNEPYQNIKSTEIPKYKPSPQDRASRSIFIPEEGWINPVLLINSLKSFLKSQSRIRFINSFCDSLETQSGLISGVVLDSNEIVSGDMYFLSPGANFTKIINKSFLEIKFPKIFYGVGCSILLKTGNDTISNCIRTPNRGLACGLYSAPHRGGLTLVGASNFISPVPEDHVRITSVHTLLDAAMTQLNTDYYRAQLVKVNVGWRPTSEDTIPLLGQTTIKNLVVATGTKRDGLHCSPLISTIMAELLLTKKITRDMSFFSPERTPVKFLTREEAISSSVEHMINAAYQHGFKSAKNRMVEDLQKHYTRELEDLHDKVGAKDWGIPAEMINMYKYGHIT